MILTAYFAAAPRARQVLDHGDLALMNALWDGGVSAVLDLEFALLGPVEVDLARLLLEVLVTEDGELVDSPAGDAAVEIATGRADPVRGAALLLGAAALDQLRDLDLFLGPVGSAGAAGAAGAAGTAGRGAGAGPAAGRLRPYRLLVGLLELGGGYVGPVLARLGGGASSVQP